MRVLTIAERLLDIELKEKFLGESGLLTHEGRDTHIVLCSMGVGLC